jgi:mRNA interferase MazF
LFRLTLPADDRTGLREPSQVMADKIMALRRDHCGPPIGHIDDTLLATLGRMLGIMVGVQP